MAFDGGDILLYSLSAWRETSWATFKRCFDEVHRRHVVMSNREEQEAAFYYRWRALRLLSSLGHVDVRFEAQGDQHLRSAASVGSSSWFRDTQGRALWG